MAEMIRFQMLMIASECQVRNRPPLKHPDSNRQSMRREIDFRDSSLDITVSLRERDRNSYLSGG
jgi:hypothetical protein